MLSISKTNAQTTSIKEVENTVSTLVRLMLKPDEKSLQLLTNAELTYGHSSGKIETRDQFIETLVSGASIFEKIDITEQSVQVVDHTAVVRHILSAQTNDPGKGPATIKLGIVLSWVKVKGQWQLLARQAYKL
ncbi:nuclear transport factor 2 family protein [Sphingobacterium sp. LRF_L2]|uniref:nuclear transport factor 2 family protein n=1 Tax=Sphingobacterium sp. LRF_L2 TaxID=3369421 RepID=UPI003F6429A3